MPNEKGPATWGRPALLIHHSAFIIQHFPPYPALRRGKLVRFTSSPKSLSMDGPPVGNRPNGSVGRFFAGMLPNRPSSWWDGGFAKVCFMCLKVEVSRWGAGVGVIGPEKGRAGRAGVA